MLGQCFELLQFRISSPFKDNRTGSGCKSDTDRMRMLYRACETSG
jgi:hypothetical protein